MVMLSIPATRFGSQQLMKTMLLQTIQRMTHCNRQLYTYTTTWYDMIGMFQSEVIAQLLSQRSSSANTTSRWPCGLDQSSVFCSSKSLIDFHLDQVKAKEAAKPAEGNAGKPWFLVIFWLRSTFVWNWTVSRTVPNFCEVEQAGRKPVADPAPNLAVGVLKYDGTMLPLNNVIKDVKCGLILCDIGDIHQSPIHDALPTLDL